MASNELAAILARRRAKDGSKEFEDSNPPPIKVDSNPINKEPIGTFQNRSLKQMNSEETTMEQGGSDLRMNTNTNTSGNGGNNTARRTSLKIQQLAGKVAGINLNAMAPGGVGGPPRRFGNASSIMKTGDQESEISTTNTNKTMQQMGGIPIHGLARTSVALPGMCRKETENVNETPPPQNLSHQANLTRVTAPKRRAPSMNRKGPTFGTLNLDPTSQNKVEDASTPQEESTTFTPKGGSTAESTKENLEKGSLHLGESFSKNSNSSMFLFNEDSNRPTSASYRDQAIQGGSTATSLFGNAPSRKSSFSSSDSDFSDSPRFSSTSSNLTANVSESNENRTNFKSTLSDTFARSTGTSSSTGRAGHRSATGLFGDSFPAKKKTNNERPFSTSHLFGNVPTSSDSSIASTGLSGIHKYSSPPKVVEKTSSLFDDQKTEENPYLSPSSSSSSSSSSGLFGDRGGESTSRQKPGSSSSSSGLFGDMGGEPTSSTSNNSTNTNLFGQPISASSNANSLFGTKSEDSFGSQSITPRSQRSSSGLFGESSPPRSHVDPKSKSSSSSLFSSSSNPGVSHPPIVSSHSSLFDDPFDADDVSSESEDEGGLFGTGLPQSRA